MQKYHSPNVYNHYRASMNIKIDCIKKRAVKTLQIILHLSTPFLLKLNSSHIELKQKFNFCRLNRHVSEHSIRLKYGAHHSSWLVECPFTNGCGTTLLFGLEIGKEQSFAVLSVSMLEQELFGRFVRSLCD